MTDEELVAAFEGGSLDSKLFTHAAHVRVAWWYLRHDTFAAALARFTVALRRFAAVNGASGKYHETITVASMALIAERLDASADASWDQFIATHPDLLDRRLLAGYYPESTLGSDRARRVFVLPRDGRVE
jgi:hypothetical protein